MNLLTTLAKIALDRSPYIGRKHRGLAKLAIDRSPREMARYIGEKHLDLAMRVMVNPQNFQWDVAKVPDEVNNFEDLSFLFFASPLNRGLLRQDMDEAALLFKTVRSLENPNGVEIGRWNGGSAVLMAVAMRPTGHLLSLDIEPQDDERLRSILARAGLQDRVTLMVADANEVEEQGPFDFAFIDGDHSYEGALKDHNRWGARVRAGGFVIHHDMGHSRSNATQWPSLKQLREDIEEHQKDVLECVAEAGSMIVFRRCDSPWKAVESSASK